MGGGTSWLRPGEISLAHAGVLFLDELGEFPATVLDALRQPLEEHVIRVRRARGAIDFPARFLLVGAMNPCPCGEGGLPGACRCSDVMRRRYLRRLSAPLLDRFDLAIALGRPDVEDLLGGPPGDSSAVVAARVRRARELAHDRGVRWQRRRFGSTTSTARRRLSADAAALLERRLRSGVLSARGLHRVRRVAQTIADLDGASGVDERQVAEALQLRAARSVLVVGRRTVTTSRDADRRPALRRRARRRWEPRRACSGSSSTGTVPAEAWEAIARGRHRADPDASLPRARRCPAPSTTS